MQKRKKNAIRNLIFGLINKIITLIIPFFIFVVIRKTLGSEFVGLNNLFASLLQMLTLAEMGLGNAMIYEMYKPVAIDDKKSLSPLLNLYKRIYRYLSLGILIIGICCIPFLKLFINGTVPNGINIEILFIIYLLNTFLSYSMYAYKKSILQAYQRNDLISKVSSIVHIIMYISQVLVLIMFKNYYCYVITLPLTTILDNILVNYIVNKMYSDITIDGNVDIETKKEIFSRVKSLAGHKIGAVVISSLDSIVISSFLGLNTLAIYSCYFYVVKALNGFVNIGFNSILSGVGNSIVLESKETNTKLFNKLNLVLIWAVGFATICLISLYQPFIEIWMGPDYLLPMHTVILFAVYFYVWQSRVMGLAFKDASGMWKDDFWKPYCGLIINLIANIVLVMWIGLDGVLISTIIVMAGIYFPWETKVLFNNLFKTSCKKYVLRMIGNGILTGILSAITYYICLLVTGNLIITLLYRGIVCIIIPNIFFWMFYHKTYEYNELMLIVKESINKVSTKIKGDQYERTKSR